MDWTDITSRSDAETEALGRALAAHLPPGCVVCLHGDLGAGKTVLARGLARGLGITEPVTSPTFTVVQEYRRPTGGWVYHLDLYRITNTEAALAFGIEEFLFAPGAVTVVEWPDRIADLLAAPPGYPPVGPVLHVHLAHVGENERRLRLTGHVPGRA